MTTTLADLLAGVDMEGGENFCDSVYNFLKNQGKDINLFTNSGFGVWSQSDTNKGLAILPFDSGSVEPVVGELLTDPNTSAVGKVISVDVTGGTWGGTNAAGNITLGAVSGTFQDNSDITGDVGGANMLTVNGDESIGRTNDPMNNDDTADWTETDCTLAFAATHYTITRTAASQVISKACSLEKGKIYKIEIDINDGTEAGVDVLGYTNSVTGVVVYPFFTTAAGWASVSWTFEAESTDAAATVGIATYILGGGNNIQVRRFSVYEITPCTTEADNVAFEGSQRDPGPDLYREHRGANTKDGSFYALTVVPSTAGHDAIAYPRAISALEEWYMQFRGRPVTFGMWVLAYSASHARIRIQDSVDSTYSAYHTGGGDYEWLEVTKVIDEGATAVQFKLTTTLAGDVDGTTIVYASQPMPVFGWSLGEGMYQPRLQEIIWTAALLTNLPVAQSGVSSFGYTTVNVEATTDARFPKGMKAIFIFTRVKDSGSAGVDTYLNARADATQIFQYSNTVGGHANNLFNRLAMWQKLDDNGDYQHTVNASGAGTFDMSSYHYCGVQVN